MFRLFSLTRNHIRAYQPFTNAVPRRPTFGQRRASHTPSERSEPTQPTEIFLEPEEALANLNWKSKTPKPILLTHVPKSAPVLHQPCEEVTFPLSQEIQSLIANMLYSIQPEQLQKGGAAWGSAVGMAANQWGFNKRIFLYGPYGENFEVIINPSYTPIEGSPVDEKWEGCFSIPLMHGLVKRWLHIRVEYYNQEGELLKKTLSGWEARVWQHENDHVNGHLFDSETLQICTQLENCEF